MVVGEKRSSYKDGLCVTRICYGWMEGFGFEGRSWGSDWEMGLGDELRSDGGQMRRE